MGIVSVDAHQPRCTRRTKGGGGEGGGGIDGIKSQKLYSTSPSRISRHIGVNIYSSMLES